MDDGESVTTIGETMTLLEMILGETSGALEGYIVVGVTATGEYLITANLCCPVAVAGELSRAAAQTLASIHPQGPDTGLH